MHRCTALANVLAVALGLICVTGLGAAAPEVIEPTPAQLKEAQESFARLKASYRAEIDPRTKQMRHLFRMPQRTTDADLAKLPRVPFPFALNLYGTQVTDAGLKELKELKQLATLDLFGTQVTDAGLKDLREALPKCQIFGP